MPIQILMPALSPTMTEGTLAKWHKKEGDMVKAGEVLAEIETDKATMEVEAVDEGKLAKILIPAGTSNVKVNEVIGWLLEEGEDESSLALAVSSIKLEGKPASAPSPQGAKKEVPHSLTPLSSQSQLGLAERKETRIFASPLAKRLAAQAGLSLTTLKGTGPAGRIVKADIESAMKNKVGTKTHAQEAIQASSYKVIPVSSMRKVIAQRLVESKQTIPHFYLTIDVAMDELLSLRAQINKAQEEAKASVNDFIIKAAALALMQVPEANAIWNDTAIHQYTNADISVAVAIENGLVTPVVRQAEKKSLLTISQEVKELVEKARNGKLKPEQWQGGTFTISNLGMFGITQFQAIINPPQGCILAIGATEQRPVVREGQVKIASIMQCSLSADHRVIDGVVGAKLLQAFKNLLEKPLKLIL